MKQTYLFPARRQGLASAGVSLLLATSLLAAPGCGGGSATGTGVPGGVTAPAAGRGQVRFTIHWPEKAATRLIPRVSESIKFVCKDADDDDEVILEKVVPRGQTVVTLDLPSVRVRIDAEARSAADGGGQVLAKGGVTVQVKEAKVAAEQLTLDSVITEVRLSRGDITVSGGQTADVTADAVDKDGAVVLTAPESWEWTPEDAAADIVSYQPDGSRLSVQARKDGTAVFTVKETESGRTARLTVTSDAGPEDPGTGPVLGQPGYVVTPSPMNLTAGDIIYPQTFWRDANGILTPSNPTYYGSSDLYQFYSMNDGTRPMVALKQGESTVSLQFGYNGATVDVPLKVSGYILTVTVPPGENGEQGEVEIYVDADMVYRGTGKGNFLGRLLGTQFYTIGVPLPVDLKPGRHYFYAKSAADRPVPFSAQIVGVASLSGTVSKDNPVTDVFYKN